MKRYILFDLDGTLLKSEDGILRCVQHALDRFGFGPQPREKLMPFIGPPLYVSFRDFYGFSDEDAEEAIRVYRERYNTVGLFEAEPYPGVLELLRDLTADGRVCALVTSKPLVTARRVTEHFGLDAFLTEQIGPDFQDHSAEKDRLVRRALTALGCTDHAQAVMVGDRFYDAEGAAAAGVDCIGALYGYGTAEELTAAGARALASSPSDILGLVREM